MITSKNRLADQLDQIEHVLVTALADPVIARLLLEFGYDPERIASGMVLRREVMELRDALRQGLKERNLNLDQVNRAYERANPVYLRSLRIARVAFREHPKVATLLKLHGERNRSIAGWLEQTEAFFYHLTREDGLGMTLAAYGCGPEKIAAANQLQKNVRDLRQKLLRDLGEPSQVTEKRDRREIQLDAWMADFRSVAKVALFDYPHQQKRLFLVEHD